MKTFTVITLTSLLAVAACIGTSPEEADRAAQGDYKDGNPEHRPGQPCLACHNDSFHPGKKVFSLAGTIFLRATDNDEEGLEGAQVIVQDALDRKFTAQTNSAGNFMVAVDKELSEPRQKDNGRLILDFQPEFPLRIRVVFGAEEREMDSLIWREGSCAGCHQGSTATASSVEKIFIQED